MYIITFQLKSLNILNYENDFEILAKIVSDYLKTPSESKILNK